MLHELRQLRQRGQDRRAKRHPIGNQRVALVGQALALGLDGSAAVAADGARNLVPRHQHQAAVALEVGGAVAARSAATPSRYSRISGSARSLGRRGSTKLLCRPRRLAKCPPHRPLSRHSIA